MLPRPVPLTIRVPHLPPHYLVLAYDAKQSKYAPVAYTASHGVITVMITKPEAIAIVTHKG